MRESAIGLGFRVPMVIASPWSRGGYVNSQVFDHTSSLQFLEKFSIKSHISYESVHDQAHSDQYVVDQRPIAGSLIDLKDDKKPLVQLKVACAP